MNPNIISHKTYTDVNIEEYEQNGWNFIFTKAGMFNTSDLDMLQDALTLQGIPDITNGNNCGLIYNKQFNFGFLVNPKDALYLCNYNVREQAFLDIKKEYRSNKVNYISVIPEQAQLKFAEKWKDKQNAEIKVLNKISDTFYSTSYKGTIVDGDQMNYQFQRFKQIKEIKGKSIFETVLNENLIKNELDYLSQIFKQSQTFYCEFTEDEIPLNNLTPSNPIKWACHIMLFEDELGDNGLTNCEFRFRVMGDCFFGLLRSYLRIDDVLIRILDTRIYYQFEWDYILRDFTHREDSWSNIQKNGFTFTPQWSVDPNQSYMIQNAVKIQGHVNDKIYFKAG